MTDLGPREWAAILPLLLLMVWMGTFTQSFMPPISAQNARILEQANRGVAAHNSPPAAKEVANAR
jgi:NADH-quinone oxidoreductase subunit M